jgi:hypothetical protein
MSFPQNFSRDQEHFHKLIGRNFVGLAKGQGAVTGQADLKREETLSTVPVWRSPHAPNCGCISSEQSENFLALLAGDRSPRLM